MTRACFVTGTGTEVGKTIVTATIVAGLVEAGVEVRARKPIVTGISESDAERAPRVAGDLRRLADHELLAAISGEQPEEVARARYRPAVSPHLAVELSGAPLDIAAIVDELRETAADAEALIVEGVGGLLVPLGDAWDVRRLAHELGWPVIVAASPGLGTINHTLLTLEAARGSGLDVRAVVLTPWPSRPAALELSNRATIEQLGAVEVAALPRLAPLTAAVLADAAAKLGYERWLEP
jgi:dethiobiotin synthetase